MARTSRSLFLLLLSLHGLLAARPGMANNIQVTNTTLTGNNGTSIQIRFDLSWENSWRGGGAPNWDAAWVFVKYRTSVTGPANPVRLNNTGHVAPAGSQIDLGLVDPAAAYNATTNPVVGVFIHRNAPGNGNLNLPGTELQWNYGALGLSYNDIAMVQVFAIEMVYVPQGAFAVGGAGTELGALTLTTINTANVTVVPSGVGSLGGQAGGLPTLISGITPGWPNGFNAFYCMKYEMSQQQYVDFLNTLTRTQQDQRTQTNIAPGQTFVTHRYVMTGADYVLIRNGIACNASIDPVAPLVFYCDQNNNGTGGDADDGRDIACNFMSWGDLIAYLDWSGLRPFTELEFEKACRGPLPPVANEYPWGTSGISTEFAVLSNSNTANEGWSSGYSTGPGLGNACYWGWTGPLRVGLLAANGSNSGRVSSGAGYYGMMELGGNLYERPITLGGPGSYFQGDHGNGSLTASGEADVPSWPWESFFSGSINRGGYFMSLAASLCVAYRGTPGNGQGRHAEEGGRGARTAP